MPVKYYIPIRGMIKVEEAVSSIDSFKDQYVNRSDFEAQIAYAFHEGKRIGAEEKALDYQAAKESRVYSEKTVINSAIESLKSSIKKLENCKGNL